MEKVNKGSDGEGGGTRGQACRRSDFNNPMQLGFPELGM